MQEVGITSAVEGGIWGRLDEGADLGPLQRHGVTS